MRKITQEEFDNFEIDENCYKICPTGDYSDIKAFGELCIFGVCCSFGERCSFGDYCKIENNKELKTMLKFEGFGSEKRCTYFFLLTNGQIYVRCGCFAGYIDEFKNKVK